MLERSLRSTLIPFLHQAGASPLPASKVTNDYRLFVPSRARTSAPLLVMIHGCAQSAESFERGSRMNELAEEHGFFVLYPDQKLRRNLMKCWNWFDPRNRRRDSGEPKEIMKMIDEVSARYPVDLSRVFLAGLSSGTALAAALLACHPERFAGATLASGPALDVANNALTGAIIQHTGPLDPTSPRTGSCKPDLTGKRLIIVQGLADATVNTKHAIKLVAQFVPQSAKATKKTLRLDSMGERPLNVTEYSGDEFDALLVSVVGMRHAWAGGLPGNKFFDAKAFSASELTVRYLILNERPFFEARAPVRATATVASSRETKHKT